MPLGCPVGGVAAEAEGLRPQHPLWRVTVRLQQRAVFVFPLCFLWSHFPCSSPPGWPVNEQLRLRILTFNSRGIALGSVRAGACWVPSAWACPLDV